MINIELDDKSVFTYSTETLTVNIWDHRDGRFEGPAIGQVGKIKFASEDQLYHFLEMLEFILNRIKNKEN